jgi:hypothetical protein
MGTFVEVNSVEKNTTVILNLDEVIEIAPLVNGGSEIRFSDARIIKVKDNYNQFKQFALQTVTSEDIAKTIARLTPSEAEKKQPVKTKKETPQFDIPKL